MTLKKMMNYSLIAAPKLTKNERNSLYSTHRLIILSDTSVFLHKDSHSQTVMTLTVQSPELG